MLPWKANPVDWYAQVLSQRQSKPSVVPETDTKRLRAAGIKSFLLAGVILALQIIIFLFSAGNIIGPGPWIFFGASFMYYTISTTVQYKFNPRTCPKTQEKKSARA